MIKSRLAALREQFDYSFSLPLPPEHVATRDEMLCFSADIMRFAIPLDCLQEIVQSVRVISVPSRSIGLIGLAAVRARLIPVYSLEDLIRMRPTPRPLSDGKLGWVAVLRGEDAVGLQISSLDGYARDQDVRTVQNDPAFRFMIGSVEHASQQYATLDWKSLYKAVLHPHLFQKAKNHTP